LTRAQPFDLSAELVRFLLHPSELVVQAFTLLDFPGERASDFELPGVPSRVGV
jgi:hypothetical protein